MTLCQERLGGAPPIDIWTTITSRGDFKLNITTKDAFYCWWCSCVLCRYSAKMLNATRFLNQATVTPSQSKKAAAIVQWILPAGGTARTAGSDSANVRKRRVSCTAGYLLSGWKGRGRGSQVDSREKKRHTPRRTSRWRACSTPQV